MFPASICLFYSEYKLKSEHLLSGELCLRWVSSFTRSDRMGCICSINCRLQTTSEQLLLVKVRLI